VEQLQEKALAMSKSIAKLGREAKAWPVLVWLKERVDAFKRTLPLITDLRNPALRPRHWDQLAERVGSWCVPEATAGGRACVGCRPGLARPPCPLGALTQRRPCLSRL
jgi:dynein heavy chain